jgi:hypothetical protein
MQVLLFAALVAVVVLYQLPAQMQVAQAVVVAEEMWVMLEGQVIPEVLVHQQRIPVDP